MIPLFEPPPFSPADFAGKVALISGASSGLGVEFARQLVAAGAKVGLIARREDRLAALVQELGPGNAAYVACSVEDRDATARAVATLEAALGPTQVVVANAGVARPFDVRHYDATAVTEVFGVNVYGAVNLIAAALPGMLERKDGHVVAISSVAAIRPMPESAAYSASKVALSYLTEVLRLETLGSGVAVTTIFPGFVKSEMTDALTLPMPFLLETAPAVRRMLSAVAAKRRRYYLPRRMYWLIMASYLLPERIFARRVRPLPD